jgi:hypothetical protein
MHMVVLSEICVYCVERDRTVLPTCDPRLSRGGSTNRQDYLAYCHGGC